MNKEKNEIVVGGCPGLLITFSVILLLSLAVLFFGLDAVLHLENKKVHAACILVLCLIVLYWHFPGLWSFGLSEAGITVYCCGFKRRVVPWDQVEKASLITQRYQRFSQTGCMVLLKGDHDFRVSLTKPRSFWRRNRKTSLYILNMGNNEKFVKTIKPFFGNYFSSPTP